MVSAALLWSTSGLFVKSPPLAALPLENRGPALACYRALAVAVGLLPLVSRSSIRWHPGLLPMVVSFAVMNLLFVTAMTRTTAAAAVFLQYTSTAWAFLLGALLHAEPIRRMNLVCLVFALLGIGWIVIGEWHSNYLVGNLLGLGSGLAYAGVIVSLRRLRQEDAVWLVVLNHLVAGLCLLPWVATHFVPMTALQWTLAAGLGVVQMGIPYVLFARGLRNVTVQEAALITLLEPILNPLWVWLFWGEPVPATTLVGGGWIVAGLLLRSLLGWRVERASRR